MFCSSKYEPLQSTQDGEPHHENFTRTRWLIRCLFCYCALSSVVIVILATGMFVQSEGQTAMNLATGSVRAIFDKDFRYTSLDPAYDHLWEALGGDGEVFDMHGEEDPDVPRAATITMFHQLHCLAGMRHAIQQARNGRDPGIDASDNPHWPHCFDYMRKSVLCWADGTVERKGRLPDGRVKDFIDGAQDIRNCGDHRELMKYMTRVGKNVTLQPFF